MLEQRAPLEHAVEDKYLKQMQDLVMTVSMLKRFLETKSNLTGMKGIQGIMAKASQMLRDFGLKLKSLRLYGLKVLSPSSPLSL